ncbi:hypothetical protein TNCV_1053091 [Trichonephila clavipes]|nr:hypothetical protein TNCV_1053091 [Trichonephila clavipes]
MIRKESVERNTDYYLTIGLLPPQIGVMATLPVLPKKARRLTFPRICVDTNLFWALTYEKQSDCWGKNELLNRESVF